MIIEGSREFLLPTALMICLCGYCIYHNLMILAMVYALLSLGYLCLSLGVKRDKGIPRYRKK